MDAKGTRTMRIATVEAIKQRLEAIYTHDESECSTELFRALVLDVCRFYGASLYLQNLLPDNHRAQIRIAAKSSKSYADDYIEAKHGVSRYWAHSAANVATHHNLPAAIIAEDEISEFINQPFYEVYTSFKGAQDE